MTKPPTIAGLSILQRSTEGNSVFPPCSSVFQKNREATLRLTYTSINFHRPRRNIHKAKAARITSAITMAQTTPSTS